MTVILSFNISLSKKSVKQFEQLMSTLLCVFLLELLNLITASGCEHLGMNFFSLFFLKVLPKCHLLTAHTAINNCS